MRAAWRWLLLVGCAALAPGALAVARQPRVTFVAPLRDAVIDGDVVEVSFRVENTNGSRVLAQVDGQSEVLLEPCLQADPCESSLRLLDLEPGSHSVAIVALGFEQEDGHLTASTLRFRTAGGRPAEYLEPPVREWLSPPSPPSPPRVSVVVLSYNRGPELRVLLDSLQRADYGDRSGSVDLVVWLDAPSNASDAANVERVRGARRVAEAFQWAHGRKRLHLRAGNANIVRGWLEAWYPEHDDDAALIIEDDIEVSPHWFQWSLRALERYSAPSAGAPIYGLCLQQQWLTPGAYMHELRPDNAHQPFLFPVFGTWGPVVFGRWWREFVWWYEAKQAQGEFTLDIPETWTNGWVRWSSYFDRFALETGAYCLYPNLPTSTALVVNHKAPGIHYTQKMADDCTLASREDGDTWLARYLRTLPPVEDLHVLWFDGTYVPAFAHAKARRWASAAALAAEPLSACRAYSQASLDLLQANLHPTDSVLEMGVSPLSALLAARVDQWTSVGASAEACAAVRGCVVLPPDQRVEDAVAAARGFSVVVVHIVGCGFPVAIDFGPLLEAARPQLDESSSLFVLGASPDQLDVLRVAGWELGFDLVERASSGGAADTRWQLRTPRRGMAAVETVFATGDGGEYARASFSDGGPIADMR